MEALNPEADPDGRDVLLPPMTASQLNSLIRSMVSGVSGEAPLGTMKRAKGDTGREGPSDMSNQQKWGGAQKQMGASRQITTRGEWQ